MKLELCELDLIIAKKLKIKSVLLTAIEDGRAITDGVLGQIIANKTMTAKEVAIQQAKIT